MSQIRRLAKVWCGGRVCTRANWCGKTGSQIRSYRTIKGVFGNYRPTTEPSNLERSRQAEWQDVANETLSPAVSLARRLVRHLVQRRGHEFAQLDPLQTERRPPNEQQRESICQALHIDSRQLATIGDPTGHQFIDSLLTRYCGDDMSFEFEHLDSPQELRWFEHQIEQMNERKSTDSGDQRESLAIALLEAEAFDHFLAKKFQSVKRYGGEGAETMLTFVDALIRCAASGHETRELTIGMPHRARLNLLVNTLQVPPQLLFRKMSGLAELQTSADNTFFGDVLSHIFACHQVTRTNQHSVNGESHQNPLDVTLLPNPSHLEIAGTMAAGFSRGQLLTNLEGPYCPSDHTNTGAGPRLCLQIHGDASFSGQGIVAETLALASVDHWTTGGSIHLVVNNQVGYTMPARSGQARSSRYSTDPVKVIAAPVIHVAADRPEAVVAAAQLAYNYRQRFGKDIAVELLCYRRWGHNELDDPTFTNPALYRSIAARNESIPFEYARTISMSTDAIDAVLHRYNQRLNQALNELSHFEPPVNSPLYERANSPWRSAHWPTAQITKWCTSVEPQVLRTLGTVCTTVPEGFHLHATLRRVFDERRKRIETNQGLDWATAESLAFGSLLWQGFDVRIAGQDVGRGTFSQRHAMVVEQESEDIYIPLNSLSNQRQNVGQLEVCNSILSEEGVLAFEYGLSLATARCLPIWEAQFGDFFNCAQSIVDTLLASGDHKWRLQSALTLLLPHGYDGAGPEHTSSKLERFLQQSDSAENELDTDQVNWTVAFPSTPAQYFHLLRRQMIRPFRRPLVVMSPKMLLRHPRAVSSLDELTHTRAHFAPILDDPVHGSSSGPYDPTEAIVSSVRSVIFCSGKHYYALEKERARRVESGETPSGLSSIALVRVEQLCPFPAEDIVRILRRYPNATGRLVWSQEEHRNMGAWNFVAARFQHLLKQPLQYAGRDTLCAPAVGITTLHHKQNDSLLQRTFQLASQRH